MKPILWFAPMDGFTDAACRSITQNIRDTYGEKDRYDFCLWTEFMTADGFVRNPEGVKHHLETTPNQTKLIAQIFGGNKETLVQAAINIQKEYSDRFTGIELNMGCPANNVMKSGGGGELLRCKSDSLEIIKDLRKAITIPFSIKTRTGTTNTDKEAQMTFLLEASKYVDMITIHARTVAEGYGPNIDREFIYTLKNKLPNQTIIGNGWVKNYHEIEVFRKHLDGVMIGQAAIGNPRIFTPHIPANTEKLETILKHLKLVTVPSLWRPWCPSRVEGEGVDLLAWKDRESLSKLVEFRKHLFSYLKGITGSKEFKQELIKKTSYHDLVVAITSFFSSL